jgi:hypothetical protein
MENSLLEALPEKITRDLPSLVDNVIAVLFKSNPARFLKVHYIPMNGTEQSLVTFEFDAPIEAPSTKPIGPDATHVMAPAETLARPAWRVGARAGATCEIQIRHDLIPKKFGNAFADGISLVFPAVAVRGDKAN